jgi:hypothetical protein
VINGGQKEETDRGQLEVTTESTKSKSKMGYPKVRGGEKGFK